MDNEIINKLSELKQKLDAGEISRDEFEQEKNKIIGFQIWPEKNKTKGTKFKEKKWWIITIIAIAIIIGVSLLLFNTNRNTENNKFDYGSVNTNEQTTEDYMIEEQGSMSTGKWQVVPILDEFREKGRDIMLQVDIPTHNTQTSIMRHANILYIPNYGFVIRDNNSKYGGWQVLDILSTDGSVSSINDMLKYQVKKIAGGDNSIEITNPEDVRFFYSLLNNGYIFLRFDYFNVCKINGETENLDVAIRDNKINDIYTINSEIRFENIPISYHVSTMRSVLEENGYVYQGEDSIYDCEGGNLTTYKYRGTALNTPNVEINVIPGYEFDDNYDVINKRRLSSIEQVTKDKETYQKWMITMVSRYGEGFSSGYSDDEKYWSFSNGKIYMRWGEDEWGEVIGSVRYSIKWE